MLPAPMLMSLPPAADIEGDGVPGKYVAVEIDGSWSPRPRCPWSPARRSVEYPDAGEQVEGIARCQRDGIVLGPLLGTVTLVETVMIAIIPSPGAKGRVAPSEGVRRRLRHRGQVAPPHLGEDKGRKTDSGDGPRHGRACPGHPRLALLGRMGGWVYIMTNQRDGTLYVGVTSNLPPRAYQHRER